MEYNTQRPLLKINDYGRTVTKMIDYAKTLPTREERTQMARKIIGVMALLNPKLKDRTEFHHILWDHLMIMADYNLDCDCPYEIDREKTESFHPHRIELQESKIRYRHYGRAMEAMIAAVAEMPAGYTRDEITAQIAHAMKRKYLQWNRDTVDDEMIAQQLLELSNGRLTLPEGFQFHPTEELLQNMEAAANDPKKKKKKKKKKHA